MTAGLPLVEAGRQGSQLLLVTSLLILIRLLRRCGLLLNYLLLLGFVALLLDGVQGLLQVDGVLGQAVHAVAEGLGVLNGEARLEQSSLPQQLGDADGSIVLLVGGDLVLEGTDQRVPVGEGSGSSQ